MSTQQECVMPACYAHAGRRPAVSKRLTASSLLAALMIVVLVGGCGIAYRSWEYRNFGALPTGFEGPLVFRQHYLLAHGSFLIEQLPTYSYWSGGVNAQLGSYLMELISAVVRGLSQFFGVQPRLLHQLVLTPLLSGFAVVLLLRRASHGRALDIALVAALATLGTPVVINFLTGWNVAYGWGLLLALATVYTSGLRATSKLGLSTLLFFTGPPLYHSFGFLFNLFAVLLWLLSNWEGRHRVVPGPVTVGVYYLIYQTHVSTLFLRAVTDGLLDVLTLEFLRRDVPIIARTPIQAGGIDLRYLHLGLYTLLALPVAIAVGRYARMRWQAHSQRSNMPQAGDAPYLTVITAMGGAVAVFGVLFGLKFSSLEFLINRSASYLIIPALLAIIYELRQRGRFFWYVYPLGCVALCISLYSFHIQAATVHTASNITHTEERGYQWLKQRLRPQEVVFTDFRLGGAFIADGHFRVVGITGEGAEPTDALLQAIYYASSPTTITAGIDRVRTRREERPADYLFVSTLMQRPYPGLNGYTNRFLPVPQGFFAALDGSPDWSLVYQNNEIRIYRRIATTPHEASR